MSATPRDILRQIERQEPAIVAAFLAYVAGVVSEARVRTIELLIQQGRVDAIAAVLGITPAALSALTEAIRSAFVNGGQFGVDDLPRLRSPAGGALRVRFDVRNPRAEAWLRNHSSTLVTAIIEDQRIAIRAAVTQGTMLGRNPRATALDIVGRMSPQTGRRTGGIVGLTSQQAGFVASARAQLLSGDPAQMRAYLTRQRRDARFDATVRRAAAAAQPLPVAEVDRIVGRYADRLLALRGETIARTESLAAFNEARDEAFQQAIDTGAVRPEAAVKIWRTAADGRVRDAHSAMAGQRVRFDQPFRSPTGAQLMHPGDTSRGAGASDIANCRCISMNRIDHLGVALGR